MRDDDPAGDRLADFTKGMSREAAARQVRVSGDADIGLHVLEMISVVG